MQGSWAVSLVAAFDLALIIGLALCILRHTCGSCTRSDPLPFTVDWHASMGNEPRPASLPASLPTRAETVASAFTHSGVLWKMWTQTRTEVKETHTVLRSVYLSRWGLF